MDDSITLEVSIDANRTVHAQAKLCGQVKRVSIKNGLHHPTTVKERLAKVEEEYSKAVSENNGQASEKELYKLYNAYKKEGENLKAAEVAEDLYKLYNRLSLNNIGLLYSNAGDRVKAIHYYQKDLESKTTATVLFNLAHEYKYTDIDQYLFYLRKALEAEPDYGIARFELIRHEMKNDFSKKEELAVLFQEWKAAYEAGEFIYHESWLISCAHLTNNFDFARKVKNSSVEINSDSPYKTANLATAKKE